MPKGTISSWIVLILAGIRESVWATALGKSQGFTEIVPYIVFIVGLILSIPSSTAYAVWVGIGAALTVLYAIARGRSLLGRSPAEDPSSGRDQVAQSDMTVASILPRKNMTATATTSSAMPMISISGSCWSRVVSFP